MSTRLYHTDFSPAQCTLDPLSFPNGNLSFYQGIKGVKDADGSLGYILPFGFTESFAFLDADIAVTPATINNYVQNQIQQMAGPTGANVFALYQIVKLFNSLGQGGSTQTPLQLENGNAQNTTDIGPVYYTFYMKLQADLQSHLGTNDGYDNWRAFTEWKTYEPTGVSDYRLISFIIKDPSTGALFWRAKGDGVGHDANHPIWQLDNRSVPVPVGTWFKVEVYFQRSKTGTGRFYLAIGGRVVFDYTDPNGLMGPQQLAINRIMLYQNYSGLDNSYQWTTGLEIWDGFPAAQPSGPAGYIYAGAENSTFTLPYASDLAYGANGSWLYLTNRTGSITFNNATFGGDPAPNVAKAGYYKPAAAVVDITPPSVPLNLAAAVISRSQINLSWTASTDNVGVTGYKVFRGGVQIATTTGASYSDTGLTAGTTYSYRVSAYDAAGNNSAQTVAVSATTTSGGTTDTTPPSAPAFPVAVIASPSQINLSWTASTDNIAVVGYKVFRNGVQIGTATGTSYSDSGRAPNTTYTYTISAYDGAGNNSALSASVSVTTFSTTAAAATFKPVVTVSDGRGYVYTTALGIAPGQATITVTCNDVD